MGCNLTDTYEPDPEVKSVPADEHPAWSPDGRYIAFNHFNPDADENTSSRGLYVLKLENGERNLIIEGSARNPDCGVFIFCVCLLALDVGLCGLAWSFFLVSFGVNQGPHFWPIGTIVTPVSQDNSDFSQATSGW